MHRTKPQRHRSAPCRLPVQHNRLRLNRAWGSRRGHRGRKVGPEERGPIANRVDDDLPSERPAPPAGLKNQLGWSQKDGQAMLHRGGHREPSSRV